MLDGIGFVRRNRQPEPGAINREAIATGSPELCCEFYEAFIHVTSPGAV